VARRRMITPDIWSDERTGKLSNRQRVLKIGLTTMSDDEGRFHANVALIRANIFPYDEGLSLADVEADLQAVVNSGYFELYHVGGARYGYDPEWHTDQKPNHPTPSRIPSPPGPLKIVENNSPSLFSSHSARDSLANSREAQEELTPSLGQSRLGQVSLGEVSVGQVSGRWTFDHSDQGNFWDAEIWTVYQELTGNKPKEADKTAIASLREMGFSSKATVRLMQIVKGRSHNAIRSLNYFAAAIQELHVKVGQAVRMSSQASVGGSSAERQQMMCLAVAREIENWDKRISERAG
jgi:hypothetical protein